MVSLWTSGFKHILRKYLKWMQLNADITHSGLLKSETNEEKP